MLFLQNIRELIYERIINKQLDCEADILIYYMTLASNSNENST